MTRRFIAWLAVAFSLCLLIPATASAQDFGVRAGVSGEPDQFYFGLHVESGPIADRLRFRPSAEVGIGDNQTLVAFNFDFVYPFLLRQSRWSLYFGGGPAANVYIFDTGDPVRHERDVRGGINAVLGLEHRDGFFTELRLGMLDSPSIKMCVGVTFGR